MIGSPGLYEIDAEAYHLDPCPQPSLNNSLIRHLLDCPYLAWWNHPKLNPKWEPSPPSRAMDLGSVAHKQIGRAHV